MTKQEGAASIVSWCDHQHQDLGLLQHVKLVHFHMTMIGMFS